MKTVNYRYAVQQGARFLLVSPSGDIKAYGNTEAVLLCSRRAKDGDKVMTPQYYHQTYPDRY